MFLVGVSTTQPDHLKFIYENHEDFSVIPSFVVQMAMSATSSTFGPENGINIDPTQVRMHFRSVIDLIAQSRSFCVYF